jgi:hypothetical protein
MKKLIFLCTISTLFVNCTKSDLPESTNTDNVSVQGKRALIDPVAHRHFYDNGGTDWGCVAPADSCLDDVVVIGTKKLSLSDFKNEIVSESTLALLNDGKLTLESKFNELTNTDYFILRKKQDNSIYVVYPVRYN